MASFEIPEEVIGVPLFVPSANNFFSVEAAGMPNGDSCLVVHGDTNRDYKAFQKAQTVSPDLFNTNAATGWAMTLWLKLSALTNDTSATFAQTLLSLQTLTANNTNASSASGGAGSTLFAMVHYGTTGVYFRRFNGGGFNSGGPAATSGNLGTGWNMLTFNITSTTNCDCYVNDASTPANSGAGGNHYLLGAVANRMLCIGAYSDVSPMNGRDGEWRIGKWAFHNHNLNLTERSLLYHAMVD